MSAIFQDQPKKEKAVLINELHETRNDQSLRNLVKLIENMVEETRIDNDRATRIKVLRNQGKIEGLLELRSHISRGLPASGITQ